MKYTPQPKKEFREVMDYKNTNIRKFQDDKQEGMRLMSSGRDAVLIVTNMYHPLKVQDWTDEEIKKKILEWRAWFYENIYGENEDFYKSHNDPLK
jgi:hypothetical protein